MGDKRNTHGQHILPIFLRGSTSCSCIKTLLFCFGRRERRVATLYHLLRGSCTLDLHSRAGDASMGGKRSMNQMIDSYHHSTPGHGIMKTRCYLVVVFFASNGFC